MGTKHGIGQCSWLEGRWALHVGLAASHVLQKGTLAQIPNTLSNNTNLPLLLLLVLEEGPSWDRDPSWHLSSHPFEVLQQSLVVAALVADGQTEAARNRPVEGAAHESVVVVRHIQGQAAHTADAAAEVVADKVAAAADRAAADVAQGSLLLHEAEEMIADDTDPAEAAADILHAAAATAALHTANWCEYAWIEGPAELLRLPWPTCSQ